MNLRVTLRLINNGDNFDVHPVHKPVQTPLRPFFSFHPYFIYLHLVLQRLSTRGVRFFPLVRVQLRVIVPG